MSSSTHFPNPECFQRQSDEFLTWLSGKPGVNINSKIHVADLRSQDAGRGVVARNDIAEDEELFTIPREHVLSVQNSNLKDLLSGDHDLDQLGPWLSLILVMIYEYLAGEKSAWAAYFKVLPREFDTLMFWSPAELQELQGSAVVDKIGKEEAEETLLEMIAPVMRGNPSLFPPPEGLASFDGEDGTRALLNIAHIMGSLIMAYAFDLEKPDSEEEGDAGDESGYISDDEEEEQLPKGMVPLADLLNADADRNNARLFQEESSLIMKAIKPIKAGEEIFNDYGEIPRADLLRRYGYVTDNYAPYDVVEISLEQICQAAGLQNADAESQPPLQLLEEQELLDDGYAIPRPSTDEFLADILPEELLLLLKTLTLPAEQLEKLLSKGKPPKPSFEHAEATILLKAIQLKGQTYATTIAQDEDLLSQLNNSGASTSSRRQKMAIRVRIGEKDILQNLSAMLTEATQDGTSASKRTASNDDESRKAKAQKT